MIAAFFPLKKLRRNGKYFLLGAILLVGALAVYDMVSAGRTWSSDTGEFLHKWLPLQTVKTVQTLSNKRNQTMKMCVVKRNTRVETIINQPKTNVLVFDFLQLQCVL